MTKVMAITYYELGDEEGNYAVTMPQGDYEEYIETVLKDGVYFIAPDGVTVVIPPHRITRFRIVTLKEPE